MPYSLCSPLFKGKSPGNSAFPVGLSLLLPWYVSYTWPKWFPSLGRHSLPNPQPLSPFTHTLFVTFVTVDNFSAMFLYYSKSAPINSTSPLTLVTSGGASLIVCGPRSTREQSLNYQGHDANIVWRKVKSKFFWKIFWKFFLKIFCRKVSG